MNRLKITASPLSILSMLIIGNVEEFFASSLVLTEEIPVNYRAP